MSYDAELGNWNTSQTSGAIALANCSCSNTIALSTEGIPIPLRLLLLNLIKSETERRCLSSQ